MFVNTGLDDQTVEFLRKSTVNEEGFEKNRIIKLTGYTKDLDEIERMLAYMQKLGNDGHSTSFRVGVDGDGAFSVKMTDENNKPLMKKWKRELETPDGKDIEYFNFD